MISSIATRRKLQEVAFFQEGPGLRNWQWTDVGMKVINGTNILPDGSIDVSNTDKSIEQAEFESRYRHFAIDEGDIVLSSSGTLGKVGRIAAEHLPLMMNTSVIRFRTKDSSILDDGYLFAFLRSPQFQGLIRTLAVGGVQQNFGPVHLKQIEIPVPPLHCQLRIASILSAYDAAIENNRRRMGLLEKAARLLYEEWFVRLRFPGHEHTPISHGIPEGWECVQLGERVTLNYGKALKAGSRVDGAFPVYGSSGILGSHEAALAKGPGIILGRKGNVGSVFWSSKDFYAIDTVYFIAAEESDLYLYYALKHMHFISTDVAVPGLNRDLAYSHPLLVPSRSILRQFLEAVFPIHRQFDTLDEMTSKLSAARDLLLPRLMSGEIAP